MTQYLLAVHIVEGDAPPSPEVMQQMYQQVDAYNSELQAAGVWLTLRSAAALDIRGTPGFVIGNEIVPGAIGLDALKQLIDAARHK